MLKTCSFRLYGRDFVINMILTDCANLKVLRQASLDLNSSFGVKISHTEFAFCERKFAGYTSLALIVADSLKDGIFITNKLNINGKMKQHFWVCIFKEGRPVVNISLEGKSYQININGDQVLSQDELMNILPLYIKKQNPSIFTDFMTTLDNSILDNSKSISIDSFLKEKINSKFIVSKINNNNQKMIVIITIMIVSLMTYFSYNYYESSPSPKKILPIKIKKKVPPKVIVIPPEVKVLKLIQNSSLYTALESLDIILNELPIEMSGWMLQGFDYTNHNHVIARYAPNSGSNIIDARSAATRFLSMISNSGEENINFINDNKIMQVKIKVLYAINHRIKHLNEYHIKYLITPKAGLQTIADIESTLIKYTTTGLSKIAGNYSVKCIRMPSLNILEFQTLKYLALSNINLSFNSIKASYHDGVPTFNFTGGIYV